MVWNIKSQQARLVQLTPSDTWGGAGLLGVTIRLDNYAGAEDRLVRVLTVEPQSPASVAGLVAEKDFLLGTTHQTLESTAQLAAVLHQHKDQVVELYVYNTDSDMVRIVALMPTLSWGGGGLLGAEVGTGYLHRLPAASRTTEGASVERKVRYVGVGGSGSKAPTSRSDNGETAPAVLELEPQLEMEPSDPNDPSENAEDDDNFAGLNEKLPTKSEEPVIEQADDETEESAPAQPVEAPARTTKTTKPDPEPSATTHPENASNSSQASSTHQEEVQDTPVASTANGATTIAPVEETESDNATPEASNRDTAGAASHVFSRPAQLYSPPGATSNAVSYGTASGSMLPPPPKMHYYNPPKMSQ